jgi:hypothetical protein
MTENETAPALDVGGAEQTNSVTEWTTPSTLTSPNLHATKEAVEPKFEPVTVTGVEPVLGPRVGLILLIVIGKTYWKPTVASE